MREQVSHRDRFFAGSSKLRPVFRDRCIQIELAALYETIRYQRSEAFSRRHDMDDCVPVPRTGSVGVGVTGPEIDDSLTVDAYRGRRSNLELFSKVLQKRFANRFESIRAVPVNDNLELRHVTLAYRGSNRLGSLA